MSPAKCTAEAESMGNIHLLEYVDARILYLIPKG